MQLFQPDNLSESEIKYRGVESPPFLETILSDYFNNYEVKKVSRLNRVEINSENYRVALIVKDKPQTILLRKYKNQSNINQVCFYLGLLNDLTRLKASVSPAINTRTGKLAIKKGKNIFAVFQFIDGDYFFPRPKAFNSVAEAIGKMHLAFNQLEAVKMSKINFFSRHIPTYYNKIKYYSAKDFVNIGLIIKHQKKVEQFDNFILDQLPMLADVADDLKSYQIRLKQIKKTIIHSDLHPHNILMKNNKVKVILDFDAMRVSEQSRDVAFAAYRFGRQFFVHGLVEQTPQNAQKIISDFINKYCTINSLSNEEINLMPIMLKDEFIRKILLVLYGIYRENNFQWAQDVNKFISAIYEINYFWPENLS